MWRRNRREKKESPPDFLTVIDDISSILLLLLWCSSLIPWSLSLYFLSETSKPPSLSLPLDYPADRSLGSSSSSHDVIFCSSLPVVSLCLIFLSLVSFTNFFVLLSHPCFSLRLISSSLDSAKYMLANPDSCTPFPCVTSSLVLCDPGISSLFLVSSRNFSHETTNSISWLRRETLQVSQIRVWQSIHSVVQLKPTPEDPFVFSKWLHYQSSLYILFQDLQDRVGSLDTQVSIVFLKLFRWEPCRQ